MKNFLKNAAIILVLAMSISACNKVPEIEFKEEHTENPDNTDTLTNEKFCSCLTLDGIHRTIPMVNEFLAGLPDDISPEQTFESLVIWLNSFPCDTDAKILYGTDIIWGHERMYGVAISVKDNKMIRELQLDFATDGNILTYSKIAGYSYYKQDAIYVKTEYTKIDKVFDFINSLELDVKQIQNGTYLSSMAANTDTLQYIINNLKAKPYTTDSWVTGHLNWYNANIVIFLTLYDMKNNDYQEDWIHTMDKYKLENYIDGPEHIIVFTIPEGTGEEWETKFSEYDFIRWVELSSTIYTIR